MSNGPSNGCSSLGSNPSPPLENDDEVDFLGDISSIGYATSAENSTLESHWQYREQTKNVTVTDNSLLCDSTSAMNYSHAKGGRIERGSENTTDNNNMKTEGDKSVDADSYLVYESRTTRIYRLDDSGKLIGSSTGSIALKVPADCYLHPEKVLGLYDEYIMSRHLTREGCTAVRDALKHEKEDSFHAIYLEWAPGVTLREWIQKQISSDSIDSLKKTLNLAYAVSRALSAIHDVGAVHNKITTDNIIVNERAEHFQFSVKIIDLGAATFLDKNETRKKFIVDGKRPDMISLGKMFYEMFSGVRISSCQSSRESCDNTSDAGETRSKKLCVGGEMLVCPLHRLKLEHNLSIMPVPYSLSRLVSTLMETAEKTQKDRYYSVKEVEDDLSQMIADPDHFLFDRGPGIFCGQLEFPRGKLYGRNTQVRTLLDLFEKVMIPGTRSKMALVYGSSGSGKSALVEQLKEPVSNAGGYFLSGKFDQMMQIEPFSAIIAAFTEFCAKVTDSGAECLERMQAKIKDVVGSDITALTHLIPCLRPIIGCNDNTSAIENVCGKEAHRRIQVIFRLLIRAIATSCQPMVLFLDDLQWADVASLELIRTLATDTESESLLFVGAYRDNEVTGIHPLSLELDNMTKKGVTPTKIKVANMKVTDVNDLIAVTIGVSRRLTLPLATIVHEKTSGNAFFVVQLLKMLCQDGFLHYSVESRGWEWDTDTIMFKTTAKDIVTLMVEKVTNLSGDIRCVLNLAACLGSHCDRSILQYLTNEGMGSTEEELAPCAILHELDYRSLESRLDVAVSEGLMERNALRYQFVHDAIQHAAYFVIPECQRGHLHLWIGTCIWKRASAEEFEDVLFTVVDQMNRGKEYVMNYEERMDLAKLNLRAGEKATLSSAFLSAAEYLKAGISFLGPAHWKKEYHLSLQLHNACAETEFCIGNYDIMSRVLEQIFTNSESFIDKLRAYYTLIHAFGVQHKLTKAIHAGFQVLEQLGEQFPEMGNDHCPVFAKLLKTMTSNQLIITQEMIDSCANSALLKLTDMKDQSKIWAMRFLYSIVLYTLIQKPAFFPLVSCRMLQLTIAFGVCKESVFGFACYGIVSCGMLNDIKGGYRFGQIALSLLDRFKDKRCLARVYSAIYGSIHPLNFHIRISLDKFLYAYEVGMRSGDVEFALVNAKFYCLYAFQAGIRLSEVDKDMRKFCRHMVDYEPDFMVLTITLLFHQAVLNLMGHSDNPLEFTGDAMDKDRMRNQVLTTPHAASHMHFLQVWLGYLYGEYEFAAEVASMVSKNHENEEFHGVHIRFEQCNFFFYGGLIWTAMAQKTGETKWKTLADAAIDKLKMWSAYAACNFRHKLALLEAESALAGKEYQKAVSSYDLAIALAGKNEFVQEQALAYERAGLFYVFNGDASKASCYLEKAHTLYLEWGARGKADQIRSRHLSLLMMEAL